MTSPRPVYHPLAPHPRPRPWHRRSALIEPANWRAVAGVVALWLLLALAIATVIVVRNWGG